MVLHCGTRDLMQNISAKNRNNTLISGINPRRDKLNAKKAQVSNFQKIELGKRNICFISNLNIKQKKNQV